MGYDVRSFNIGQLQSDGSIWNPKRMNKLIYTEFFTILPKYFIIFTQAAICVHWRDLIPMEDKSIPFTFFLTFEFCFNYISITLSGSHVGRLNFDIRISEQLESWTWVLNFPLILVGRHCRSNETICSLSFEVTCLEMQSYDFIFS